MIQTGDPCTCRGECGLHRGACQEKHGIDSHFHRGPAVVRQTDGLCLRCAKSKDKRRVEEDPDQATFW